MMGLASNRSLLFQLTRRDIAQRYRSSALGFIWLFVQPLLQLALYSFVFQVVLRARWGIQSPAGSEVPFGLLLFVGLILHALLSETLVRAPATVTAHESYVKRVIFPIHILPVINVAASLFTLCLAMCVLLVATVVITGHISWSALLVVIPVLALTVLTMGLGWMLASLGVYIRDLSQLTPHLSTILLFTAPICYPIGMVPEQFHWLLKINPLTLPVEMSRRLLFEGVVDLSGIGTYGTIALVIFVMGRMLFERLRTGFADVL